MELTLYSPIITGRLPYIAEYLFEYLLAGELKLTDDIGTFRAAQGPCINYSGKALRPDEVLLVPHGLLTETGVQEQSLQTSMLDGVPICFTVAPGGALPFDPLAASFFMLSRYEEYLPYQPDAHNRFSAAQSWAARSGALDRPIIWEWLKLLIAEIKRVFPEWGASLEKRSYQFCPTYDIDIPWAYRYRGWRGWARAALELVQLQRGAWQNRIKAWMQAESDPFFTFPALRELHMATEIQPLVFWLLGQRSQYDTNPNPRSRVMRGLIQEVAQWAECGLHPSYRGGQHSQRIVQEKALLEEVLEEPVVRSRQHFLRFTLPHTYRELLAAGIRSDYSMGYAEQPGFRAGTSEPFHWYDLAAERKTDLLVFPFAVMDVTLKNYQQMSPQEAQVMLQGLQAYCQTEGLTFCTLWHNSSFSEAHGWAGWWEVYRSLFLPKG